jgi:hypothetical protein
MIEHRYTQRGEVLKRTHVVSEWLPISVSVVAGTVMVLLLALISTEIG